MLTPEEANAILAGLEALLRAKLLVGDRREFRKAAVATVLGALIFEAGEYNQAHDDRVSVADMLEVLAAVGDQLKSR